MGRKQKLSKEIKIIAFEKYHRGEGIFDIAEFSIPGDDRILYLSPIMNLYVNSIIEYELSFRNNNSLVFRMFDKAIHRYPDAKSIFHSDRGFQYTGNVFKSKIEETGMTQSMSRVGKCIDTCPMEGFLAL